MTRFNVQERKHFSVQQVDQTVQVATACFLHNLKQDVIFSVKLLVAIFKHFFFFLWASPVHLTDDSIDNVSHIGVEYFLCGIRKPFKVGR